jgi:hypothetical protein
MGDLGAEDNGENVSLCMSSPTETDSLEGMEGCTRATSTRRKSDTNPWHMNKISSSNPRIEL